MVGTVNINAFFKRQLEAWPQARDNYRKLRSVERRSIGFGRFRIDLQFNPGRTRSTAADTGGKAIAARECFLCGKNRPPEQKAIPFGDYEILVNPYPIFDRHLTIVCREHAPQSISGRVGDMVSIAEAMPEFTVMYNGASSGASAPDHMHFQAVPKGNLPLETDIAMAEKISGTAWTTVSTIENYSREVFVINAGSRIAAISATKKILDMLAENGIGDAMANIFVWKAAEGFTTALFPRSKHRPSQFYAEGEDRIIFSPGAIDMAGTVITVHREDFDRLTPALLEDMLGQVTISHDTMKKLKTKTESMP